MTAGSFECTSVPVDIDCFPTRHSSDLDLEEKLDAVQDANAVYRKDSINHEKEVQELKDKIVSLEEFKKAFYKI